MRTTTKLVTPRCLGLPSFWGAWQRLSVSLMLVMLCSIGAWAQGFTLHPTSGTEGEDDQNYDKLFDGIKEDESPENPDPDNTSTMKPNKWCVDRIYYEEDEVSYIKFPIWVEFYSDVPIIPTGYVLTTGDDNSSWTGRNPKSWTVYGKVNEDDEDWFPLHKVSDDDTMLDENYTDYTFTFTNSTAYQYFRFEIDEIQNSESNVFQLSEFAFIDDNTDVKDLEEAYFTGLSPYYQYTGSAINLGIFSVRDYNGNVVDHTYYTLTVTNSNNETVNINSIVAPDTYTITANANNAGEYLGSKSWTFNVVAWDFANNLGGWCGVSSVNGGRNVYHEKTLTGGENTLTVSPNPAVAANSNFNMRDGQLTVSVDRVEIADGVTGIGASNFYNDNYIKLVTIGKDVTSIGADAFKGCTSVEHIFCYANCAALTWNDNNCDDFKSDKATLCHVTGNASTWTAKFGNTVNVTFVGDLNGIDKNLNYATADGLTSMYGYTGSAITISYTLKNIYGETIPSDKYTATITNSNNDVVTTVIEKGNYTLTITPASGSCYAGTLVKNFSVAINVVKWGNCGNPDVNNGENVVYLITEMNGVRTLTISKNPDASADSDFSMADYGWEETDEGFNNFAPWIEKYPNNIMEPGDPEDPNSGYEYFDHWDLYCNVDRVVIEDGVTSIGNNAFRGGGAYNYYRSEIVSVSIPNSVTSIGEDAFYGCYYLTSVTIPTSVTYFGFNAFCEVGCVTVSLQDTGDNSDLIRAMATAVKANVTLSGRTLVRSNWNTLCLPFSMDAAQIAASDLAEATIKELDNSDSGSNLAANGTLTLKFTTVYDPTDAPSGSIEAGKPYIVKWKGTSGTVSDPAFNGVDITSTTPIAVKSYDNKVTFVGQFSPFKIGDVTNGDDGNLNEILMLGSGNTLGYSQNARTLKCFRAHFFVPADGGAQAARAFVLDFGDETSSIHNAQCTLHNEADAVYDLQGRRMTSSMFHVQSSMLKKGVYIVNGKKVVVK